MFIHFHTELNEFKKETEQKKSGMCEIHTAKNLRLCESRRSIYHNYNTKKKNVIYQRCGIDQAGLNITIVSNKKLIPSLIVHDYCSLPVTCKRMTYN